MSRQRLRIRYALGDDAKGLSQREVARAWEAALALSLVSPSGDASAADQSSAGSSAGEEGSGFRVAFAAPLPAGATSAGEVLDVYSDARIAPEALRRRLDSVLPPGLSVVEVAEAGLGLPALQADVRWAEYTVALGAEFSPARAAQAVAAFLATTSLPWEQVREKKTRRYDMRTVVRQISAREDPDKTTLLSMRLQTDGTVIGRPEQVVAALGLGEPASVHRTALGFETKSPALAAWRRTGRFSEGSG